MDNKVLGIHHITAIAGYAKRNYDFYTKVLGLRFIKKTVNFDDPKTYHFYFGDEVGSPGTILTFFPWEGIPRGKQGSGMATEIGYSVPDKSLEFWTRRFNEYYVRVNDAGTRFNEEYISFEDPDGLPLTLIVPKTPDNRQGWETDEVKANVATKGFHSITLTLANVKETARVLTDIFDYKFYGQEGQRYRYITTAVDNGSIVDLVEDPAQKRTGNGGGTIHHVAFRVKNEEVLMAFRKKVLASGLNITDKIDRNYFFSLYFREPGGVLFELATDNPGFSIDEPVSELGMSLKLPAQYESARKQIEAVLPSLA
ncbi:ring-cleaving dioxygenase [Chryseolinea sp. H1M3-3]|uniref:ring-cleaving dioxygenase n=1 Tax=Chryseolinea sp. H1M3-3 TaxID=3034144 RepID=UPI0023EC583E|nr:ring-cleaving dioxygenase [Chryseolinea sp. H1M3-3]